MRPIEHADALSQDKDIPNTSKMTARTPFPLHYYIFFGIVEPISVMGGVIYAVFLQEKCHAELIPAGYLDKIAPKTVAAAAQKGARKFWQVATQESTGINTVTTQPTYGSLNEPTSMALAQLGSCYFLICLNSALMLYFIRKHFSHSPASQERVLYAFFFVLGAADWTHVLLTIHHLPSVNNSSSKLFIVEFGYKLLALTDYRAWNSLLFGNILITLMLFTVRAAWWMGLARDTFLTPDTQRKTQ